MASPHLDELGERLGIVLRDPEAIRQAFIHSSYHNENPEEAPGHNERLEFLGDAVVTMVVTRLLYDRFPSEDEGFLTARRAALVNRDSLASLAIELGLDRYLLLGRGEADGGGAARPSLLAATFEAVAGAVAVSEGPLKARRWLRALFDARLEPGGASVPPKSAKSRLQEWTQRHHHQKPQYELAELVGPAHRQAFTVSAVVDGRPIATGHGSSRQRAEEDAAALTLAVLEADSQPAGDPG
ncbi:MAG: ribonuclease III [Chloroflexota bacterium]|nr:ribonuclease III [Chloroflexota bacterium]